LAAAATEAWDAADAAAAAVEGLAAAATEAWDAADAAAAAVEGLAAAATEAWDAVDAAAAEGLAGETVCAAAEVGLVAPTTGGGTGAGFLTGATGEAVFVFAAAKPVNCAETAFWTEALFWDGDTDKSACCEGMFPEEMSIAAQATSIRVAPLTNKLRFLEEPCCLENDRSKTKSFGIRDMIADGTTLTLSLAS
jgi:hypothetical protein